MSAAARFFARVQRAGFYEAHLQEALALLPPGGGQSLLDAGCGPGLLSRLGARRGYRATGIDADPAMVEAARRIARREGSPAEFACLPAEAAADALGVFDVVAAASLLVVVPDPAAILAALWRSVAPGGSLLVVEAGEGMTVAAARGMIGSGLPGPGRPFLMLWAAARQGRTLDPRVIRALPDSARRIARPLLGGMATATLVRRLPVIA